MTSFSQLMDEIVFDGAVGRVTITDDWMQGRTTYGGLTAALCHRAARPLVGEDKRLRAAQIAFIGPAGGPVELHASVLREGRSPAFIGVDLIAGEVLAARAIYTFGQNRASALHRMDLPMPDVVSPDEATGFFPERGGPNFAQHFNSRLAYGSRPVSGADTNAIGLWLRHKDEAAWAGSTALIALADAPPPAALSMVSEPAMISSMTWGIDIIDPDATTRDGWWFAQSVAETAMDGYSAQAMTLWNADGRPAMASRQTVALFG